MKWLIAPDSFKNCLRSPQVAAQLAAGIRDISPDDEIIELPLADGGEGTAEAAARAAGGTLESVPVTGPLGNPVEARFARLPAGTVVVEMAEVAGLERLPDGKNDPLRATTYGVGELFLKLLKNGTRDFVIGIGGSATVDGGLGFVQALGAVCRDAQGRIIPPGAGGGALSEVAALDCSALPPELVQARIRIGSDVTNPLTGPRGAARVFGPQKGAGPGQVETLEAGLRRWAELWRDAGDVPGDGAAGGLGFLLRRLGATTESGAELLLGLAGFDRKLAGTGWVVTGEGRTDRQSLDGKLCSVVAARAARAGVGTILCSGALEPGLDSKLFAAMFSIGSGPVSLAEAFAQTPENLRRMGRNLANLARKSSL